MLLSICTVLETQSARGVYFSFRYLYGSMLIVQRYDLQAVLARGVG